MSEKWLNGEEVRYDQFMTYVMSKVSSFVWVRYDMFSEDNIYKYPPVFCWRYTKKQMRAFTKKSMLAFPVLQGK